MLRPNTSLFRALARCSKQPACYEKRLTYISLTFVAWLAGDPDERNLVIEMLEDANAQQWVVVNHPKQELNGRIAQICSISADGLRGAIIEDAEPTKERPYYEKSAVRGASLRPDQLRKVSCRPVSSRSSIGLHPWHVADDVMQLYRCACDSQVPPPPLPLKQWPLGARFGCWLAGKSKCSCAFSPKLCSGPPVPACMCETCS